MKSTAFDPAKYDRLETLCDFVKAFLLRDKRFLADINRLKCGKTFHSAKERIVMHDYFSREYSVEVSAGFRKLSEMKMELGPQVWAVGCRYDAATRRDESFLAPEVRTDLVEPLDLPFRTVNAVFLRDYRDQASLSKEELQRMDDFYSDKLCMMVNLNVPIGELLALLGKVVRLHKARKCRCQQPEKVRMRRKEWKVYLMAYDLRQEGLTYCQIMDALKLPSSVEVKDVKRYCKECKALINGGYKVFLHGTSSGQ